MAAVTDVARKSWRPSGGRAGNPVITAAQRQPPRRVSGCLWTAEMSLCLLSGTLISPETTGTHPARLRWSPNGTTASYPVFPVSQPRRTGRVPFIFFRAAQGDSHAWPEGARRGASPTLVGTGVLPGKGRTTQGPHLRTEERALSHAALSPRHVPSRGGSLACQAPSATDLEEPKGTDPDRAQSCPATERGSHAESKPRGSEHPSCLAHSFQNLWAFSPRAAEKQEFA